MLENAEKILAERFGHRALLSEQVPVVERVLGGGDALVVWPTGAGKSLCFQLPALVKAGANEERGVTLVFSPLIALMEDQVAALKKKGIAAEYINSSLGKREREKRYAALAAGKYNLIYATPERMAVPGFREAIESVPGGVNLLAVDEAHCISKWGHDLRPAYSEVGAFRRDLGCPTTVALTATATRAVRRDIRAVLGLDEEAMPLFAQPVARENLALSVAEVWDEADKIREIAAMATEMPGTGIVYTALIKDLDRYADLLRRALPDRRVMIYHGRLDPREKKAIYKCFIDAKPSDNLLLVATNAFGMGVDKPDLRFIVHAQLPGSVEAYAQEVGRAGRDGLASKCVLLYAEDDLAIQQEFVEWQNPGADILGHVAEAMAHNYGPGMHADFDVDEIRRAAFGIGHAKVGARVEYALITFEKMGIVERTGIDGRYRMVRSLIDGEIDETQLAEKRTRDLMRLLEMVRLTKAGDVAAFVTDYFD